jgi:transposase
MLNGILWILRTGAPWRDLPYEFGPWETVYTRFNAWAKSPFWNSILDILAGDADLESIMVDGSYTRAHQHSAGGEGGREAQDIGRSRGGFTIKIHAVVDSLGNPIRLKLTGGNAHDSLPALELIEGLTADNVIADKAYDAQTIIELIKAQGSNPVIPPKKDRIEQREYD